MARVCFATPGVGEIASPRLWLFNAFGVGLFGSRGEGQESRGDTKGVVRRSM